MKLILRSDPSAAIRAFRRTASVAFLLIAGTTINAHAYTIFNDRPSWLSSIGGSTDFFEDFQGLSGPDIGYGFSPQNLGPFTVSQPTGDPAPANLIDIDPPDSNSGNLSFTNTNYLRGYVDAEGLDPFNQIPITILLTFSSPLSAWGADYSTGVGGEGLTITFPTSLGLQPVSLNPGTNGFIGIQFDPATDGIISSFGLQATTPNGASDSGQIVGFDNIAGSFAPIIAIPEPATVVLLSLGLAGLQFKRRPGRASARARCHILPD